MRIPIDQIAPSPNPVRKSWDEEKMEELAQSIREQGLIVPIKVRPNGGGAYEIVYGHRRVEACKRAGLTEIEATVEGVNDTNAIAQALIENLQREDMQPVDAAQAFSSLMELTGWSTREIERRGILSHQHVGRLLKLLDLPLELQDKVSRGDQGVMPPGKISEVHVRETRNVFGGATDSAEVTKVLQKTIKEGLTHVQAKRVAESIAAAPTERAREVLLEEEYNPVLHNPERIKQRNRDYGAHDPIWQAPAEISPAEEWERLPEVRVIIDATRDWESSLKDFKAAVDVGKMSSETQRFLGRQLVAFGDQITEWGMYLIEEGSKELERINGDGAN